MRAISRLSGFAPRRLATLIALVAAAAAASCGTPIVYPDLSDDVREGPPVVWTSVAVGFGAYFDYVCGVVEGGVLYCWGETPSGPSRSPMRVSLPAPVSDVAAGWTHACVLTPEKKALCWGRNGYYASEIPAPPTVVFRERSFRTLAAGNHSACGVEVGGDLVCWKGTLTPESFFAAKGLAVSRLTLSSLHACALTAEGVAYCWGNGREGQLGDGTARDRAAPVRVAGTLKFRSLAAGTYHTCGITLDGEAYCWGWDNFSGVSPLSPSSAPVRIAGDLRFTSVASGFQFSCGISDEGYAYCWGRNEQGELGNPNAGRSSASPVRVGGALRFASLAAGGNNACGITTAGQLFCWGSDVMGQLGIGSTPDPETWRQFKGAPTRVPNPLP